VTAGASAPEHRRSPNLRLEREAPDDLPSFRPARQRAAGAHYRGHEGSRLQREDTQRLHSKRPRVRGLFGRSPDTATAEHLRRFQHHQAQTGVRPPSINSAVAALRFFFTVTLDRPDLARRLTVVREPRLLPAY
jgi:hypothetical protein